MKTIVYLYDSTGAPIGFRYRTPSYAEDVWDDYYYEKNMQGDIVRVYNSDGVSLVSYVYTAWGERTSTTYHHGGANTTVTNNPFTYRGYYYDKDLDLYYLQSRYYDSKVCRFISPDTYISTGQGIIGHNMYAYCNNNPVNYVDHTGEFPWLVAVLVSIVSAAYVITVSEIISDLDKDDEFSEALYKSDPEVTGRSNHKAIYAESDVDTLFGETYNVDIDLGIYDDIGTIDDCSSINIDVLRTSASLSCTGISAGVYLASIAYSRTYNVLGKNITVTLEKNIGAGVTFSLGKKTAIGFSKGVGGIISIEIEDCED